MKVLINDETTNDVQIITMVQVPAVGERITASYAPAPTVTSVLWITRPMPEPLSNDVDVILTVK